MQPYRHHLLVLTLVVFAPAVLLANLNEHSIAAPEQQSIHANWLRDPVTRVRDWQEDIDFLSAELPKRHANAFFQCPRENFLKAAASLRAAVPRLGDHEVVVGMMKLTALLGDPHTRIPPDYLAPPFHFFPLSVYLFSDGPFITATGTGQEHLIGCRLIRFGDAAIDEALKRASVAAAYDNEGTFKDGAPRLLVTTEVAHAFGLIPSVDRVAVVVRDRQGKEKKVDLTALKPGERLVRPVRDETKLPLSRQRRKHRNWFELLTGRQALYFRYDACDDDPNQTMANLSAEMLGAIDANALRRVIIDLRGNSGGNSRLLTPFMDGLKKRPAIHRPGGVLVLIGRYTFSSANLNAASLKQTLGATLLGEPTGQKPNHYGEVREFALPRSRIPVLYSTKFWRTEPGDRPALAPDRLIPVSSTEYFALKDPVLDAALAYRP